VRVITAREGSQGTFWVKKRPASSVVVDDARNAWFLITLLGERVKCVVFDYMVQNGRSDQRGARVGESGLRRFRRAARNAAFVSAARVT
jgi:hypothetical protein